MKEQIIDMLEERRDDHYEARDNAETEWGENHHSAAAAALQMAIVEISEMEEEE